jgi:hypothetical protein
MAFFKHENVIRLSGQAGQARGSQLARLAQV